jgi:hypothetical protein
MNAVISLRQIYVYIILSHVRVTYKTGYGLVDWIY